MRILAAWPDAAAEVLEEMEAESNYDEKKISAIRKSLQAGQDKEQMDNVYMELNLGEY